MVRSPQTAFEFDAPRIENPAPSVMGSESSRAAAERITKEPNLRARSYRIVMQTLLAHGALTREQLSLLSGIKESTLCARLSELRPTWVERHDSAGKSSSGFRVDTYELTELGKSRAASHNRSAA